MVSSTPRPHFNPGKDPVRILQETEWAPGQVWTGGKSRPHRDLYIYIYMHIRKDSKQLAASCTHNVCQTDPGTHPTSCTMDTGSFPRVKSGRGVMLTPDPLLVPWSRKRRAIPLLPLWAVRPVQSLCACTRVHFTFLYINIYRVIQEKSNKFCWYMHQAVLRNWTHLIL